MGAISRHVRDGRGRGARARRRRRRALSRARHRRVARRARTRQRSSPRCAKGVCTRSGSPRRRPASPRSHAPAPTPDPGRLARRGRARGRAARTAGGRRRAGAAGPVLVVELEGTLSVAAGPPAHDLADDPPRARRRRRSAPPRPLRPHRCGRRGSGATRAPARSSWSRDVDRHPWQRTAASAIAAADPERRDRRRGLPERRAALCSESRDDVRRRAGEPHRRRRAAHAGTTALSAPS